MLSCNPGGHVAFQDTYVVYHDGKRNGVTPFIDLNPGNSDNFKNDNPRLFNIPTRDSNT